MSFISMMRQGCDSTAFRAMFRKVRGRFMQIPESACLLTKTKGCSGIFSVSLYKSSAQDPGAKEAAGVHTTQTTSWAAKRASPTLP